MSSSPADYVVSQPGRVPAAQGAGAWAAAGPWVAPEYASPGTPVARPAKADGPGVTLALFGVVLPAVVIVVELLTGMCASTFFDPIPTPWHLAMAASVPLANFVAWVVLYELSSTQAASHPHQAAHPAAPPPRPEESPRPWVLPLGVLNGFAIAAGAYYAVLFLPLMPLAVFAIIFFGMGFLPMAPLTGFIAALRARHRLAAWAASAGHAWRGTWPGIALGFVTVGALVVPGVLTSQGLRMAASEDPAVREDGVALLRRFGSERKLLAACGEWRRAEAGNPWEGVGGRRVSPAAARQVFYRVTGKPFESVPSASGARRGVAAPAARWDDDLDLQGREVVGTLLPGLSAETSKLDGWVNGDAATAYFEWTMEFRNAQTFAQEARTRIALPRGACVSRLTLWINGEEREAAWGGRGQVRQAYENVVRVERRDPVLVTHAGTDRVIMQCFPVPPGGLMKVRVGVSAPLELSSPQRGDVRLPRLLDRNFHIDTSVPHAVCVRSERPLVATDGSLTWSPRSAVLRGRVPDGRLSARVTLSAERDPAATLASFPDSFDKLGMTVVQRIEQAEVAPPKHVVLALDTSKPMERTIDAVADALDALPAGIRVTALASTDGGAVAVAKDATRARDVAAALRRLDCAGGQDGVPLLAAALEAAAREPGGVVVWVHGAQPVVLEPAEKLARLAEKTPRVIELQTGGGRDVVGDALSEVAGVEVVEASADTKADVRRLLAGWAGPAKQWRAVRQRAAGRPSEGEGARRGDVQMVRLWAREEVARLCATGTAESRAAALNTAVSHQIVTPVSGAVVLETKAQYDAAGLTPAAAVPLPAGVWAALATIPLVVYAWRRSRRAAAV